jgi:hypothetical protein
MANPEHLAKLMEGVEAWNKWMEENPDVNLIFESRPRCVTNLGGSESRPSGPPRGVPQWWVPQPRAPILGAPRRGESHWCRPPRGVPIRGRPQSRRPQRRRHQRENLTFASLVGTNFERANLTGCRVYGVSAWDIQLAGALHSNLAIYAAIRVREQVDNLDIAHSFICF